MNNNVFAKGVEKLINPIEVGTIHFVQQLNSLLPKSVQTAMMSSSGKKFPQMGFVVEPYSFFLFYEIEDIDKAQKLLPEGFKLIKTKIFDNDEPKYYVIFGCIRCHTSAFWGARVEFYMIAENEKTGLLSWIIMDYDTNTIGYDKKNGLRAPNCKDAVITINHRGRVFVDFNRDDGSRKLIFDGDVESGKFRCLDQRLWLEGNLSVGYGKDLDGNLNDIFSLKFEPCEVEKALEIPVDKVNVEVNNWFPGLFNNSNLSAAVCFPYAQHFISDSPGASSQIKDKDELVDVVDKTKFEDIVVFNTSSIKTMFIVGGIMSFLTTVILVTLLILS